MRRLILGTTTLLLSVGVSWGFATASAATWPAASDTVAILTAADELERQKLEQEIRQLELENERASGFWGWALALGPFITVIVGVLALGGSLYKQNRDYAMARRTADKEAARWREESARQQRNDLEERQREHLRRFDERLTTVAANIGSNQDALRLNAAAVLGLFIKDEYEQLHCDLLNLIIANLKAAPEPPAVADLLRGHLAKVLHMMFREGKPLDPGVGDRIDLTGIDLYRVDLHDLDLRGSVELDLAFARLKHANFTGAKLFRARGGEAVLDNARFSRAEMNEARFNKARTESASVHFHVTSLMSATFDDARPLRGDFQEAKLQGAKFRRADLRGSRFEGANLSDAYFQGAELDPPARRSIALGARNWRKAHFDPDVAEDLEQISASA